MTTYDENRAGHVPAILTPETQQVVWFLGTLVRIRAAGPGAVAFLPRRLPHAFTVTSPQARFLTIHTPGGFDQFTLAVGTSAEVANGPPVDEPPLDPAALAPMASGYGIEILGPPPTP